RLGINERLGEYMVLDPSTPNSRCRGTSGQPLAVRIAGWEAFVTEPAPARRIPPAAGPPSWASVLALIHVADANAREYVKRGGFWYLLVGSLRKQPVHLFAAVSFGGRSCPCPAS